MSQTVPTHYPLLLPKQHLDVIGEALGELPFKTAAPVFAYLQQACAAHEKATANEETAREARTAELVAEAIAARKAAAEQAEAGGDTNVT